MYQLELCRADGRSLGVVLLRPSGDRLWFGTAYVQLRGKDFIVAIKMKAVEEEEPVAEGGVFEALPLEA